MLVYIVALALVGAIGVLDYRLRKSTDISRAAYALIFLTLASVMGLRSASVGIDTYSYSQYFTRIVQSSDPEHYMNIVSAAPIYSIYNKILGMVSDNPQILILVSSLVICSGVLFFIFTFSRNAVLSVFLFVALYFYIDCFNGMRQGLAMTLALVAYALLFKGKRVPAILFYVCAIGTHATALIMAPFYILLLFDFSTRRFKCIAAAIMVASVMFALFSEQLVALFIRSFGYSQYLDLFTSEAYQTTGKNILRSIFYAAILVHFFCK